MALKKEECPSWNVCTLQQSATLLAQSSNILHCFTLQPTPMGQEKGRKRSRKRANECSPWEPPKTRGQEAWWISCSAARGLLMSFVAIWKHSGSEGDAHLHIGEELSEFEELRIRVEFGALQMNICIFWQVLWVWQTSFKMYKSGLSGH